MPNNKLLTFNSINHLTRGGFLFLRFYDFGLLLRPLLLMFCLSILSTMDNWMLYVVPALGLVGLLVMIIKSGWVSKQAQEKPT